MSKSMQFVIHDGPNELQPMLQSLSNGIEQITFTAKRLPCGHEIKTCEHETKIDIFITSLTRKANSIWLFQGTTLSGMLAKGAYNIKKPLQNSIKK